MRFGFDEDQEAIRRAAAEMLAVYATPQAVRSAAESHEYDERLWAQFVSLDWPGLTISEQHGGVGLGMVEAAAVIEQVAYALAPAPLLSELCAAMLLDCAGSEQQRTTWLPQLASGTIVGTIGAVYAGAVPAMPDAEEAAVYLFVDGQEATLSRRAEVRLEPYESIDRTRRYARTQQLAGEPLPGPAAEGVARAEVALAAELTGLAQRALDMTVAYVRERRQFGHPIGAFQGISHRCAEMLAATEAARSATYFAAWAADSDPGRLPAAAAIAKATAATTARQTAAMAIQAHGALGYTWEADVHWIFKRAYATSAQLTGADVHFRAIARMAARTSNPTEEGRIR